MGSSLEVVPPDLIYWSVGLRMGSSPSGRGDFRLLVSIRKRSSHQRKGDDGHSPGSAVFPSSTVGPGGGCLLRQRDSYCLSEEAGGHRVASPESGGPDDPQMGRGESSNHSSSVHSSKEQCPGRFPLTSEPSHRFGVDLVPGSSGQSSKDLASKHRSVHHIPELLSPGILCSSEGSHECRNRFSSAVMGPHAGVRLSTFLAGKAGAEKGEVDKSSRSDSNRSFLAPEGVVPRLVRVAREPPLWLPERRDLLKQPHFHRFHQGVHTLNIHALRLSSSSPGMKVSLLEWLGRSPLPAGSPLP